MWQKVLSGKKLILDLSKAAPNPMSKNISKPFIFIIQNKKILSGKNHDNRREALLNTLVDSGEWESEFVKLYKFQSAWNFRDIYFIVFMLCFVVNRYICFPFYFELFAVPFNDSLAKTTVGT